MSVMDILDKRAAFSFEVFPPRTDVGMEKLCGENGVLEKLYTLNPDYISCTYGAGGTNVGKNLEVLDKIVKDGKTLGAIAILGPARMDYAKVLATLEGLSGNITSLLDQDHKSLPNGRNQENDG